MWILRQYLPAREAEKCVGFTNGCVGCDGWQVLAQGLVGATSKFTNGLMLSSANCGTLKLLIATQMVLKSM